MSNISILTSITALVILCVTIKFLSRPVQPSPNEPLNRLASIYSAGLVKVIDLFVELTSLRTSSLQTGRNLATNIHFQQDVDATEKAVTDLQRVLDEIDNIKNKLRGVCVDVYVDELVEQVKWAEEAQDLWFEVIEEAKEKWQMRLSILTGEEVKKSGLGL